MKKCAVVDPLDLMLRYLFGKEKDLSKVEKEILLFALYTESKGNPTGLAVRALEKMKGEKTSA